jgi:putative PIN family toxin of toxin-antitoxin system
MRVLLDANIFISHLLKPDADGSITQVVTAGFTSVYTLLAPAPLIEEFTQKISHKPYLNKRITVEEVGVLCALIEAVADPLSALQKSVSITTRDPKDDYLLAYAQAGQADYLVTGDADLLVLGQVGPVRIVSPAAFAALLSTDEETA